MSNHDEDDVENVQDNKSKQWGAQDMNKASSKVCTSLHQFSLLVYLLQFFR